MPTERVDYTAIADPDGAPVRHRESFVDAPEDLPSNEGRGHVYFWAPGHNEPMMIEGDVSPQHTFVREGDLLRLTAGHVLIYCPKCAVRFGRMSPLHIMADNKTVFVKEAARHYVPKSAQNRNYFLSTLTVLEPVACNYREQARGACDWRARIAEGQAYEIGGAGLIFAPKGTT